MTTVIGGKSSSRVASACTHRDNLLAAMLAAASPFLRDADNDVPTVLPSGYSALVVKQGRIVIKAHRMETTASDLNSRLRLIARAKFRDLFVQPLRYRARLGGARLLTFWPAGTAAVANTPEEINWEGNAELLSALHRTPIAGTFAGRFVPDAGWLSRLARSCSQLLTTANRPEKRTVLAAFTTLPPIDAKAWRARRLNFVHGDWHPGQAVSLNGVSRLIDVDDVGIGDPAWDLARPAGWRLAGFLSDAVWNRFLNSYLKAGGSATWAGDPWARLELPARAAVIQGAAKGLIRADRDRRSLENFELELVNVCGRIAKLLA